MTETERQRLRNLKVDAIARLRKGMVGKKGKAVKAAFDEADIRIWQHLESVRRKPMRHCLREIQACARMCEKARRYDWRAKEVRMRVKILETLPHSGSEGKEQFSATAIEVCMIADVYGFYNQHGRRVTQMAYWIVPRKFGKTEITASLAVGELFFGDYNAECYIASNSYGQAKIGFDRIRRIMFALDNNGATFRINREQIFYENGERDSLIRCLSCNPDTLDGLFASMVILDEYAQAHATASTDGSEMKSVLTTSMGPRENPLTIIITTASKYTTGPCAQELEGVRTILNGDKLNDTISAWVFEPDVDDTEDDPKTWYKVHPHLGITVKESFYAEQYAQAQLSAQSMNAFRTKLLNIFAIDATQIWIDPKFGKAIEKHFNPMDGYMGAGPATMAFDLSESGDLTAVSTCLYLTSERKFLLHTQYFFARGAMENHHNRMLYETWADQGHLILTDGDVIDYDVVADYILQVAQKMQIVGIGYDQWKSKDLVNQLKAAGGEQFLMPVSQTYGNFTSVCQFFEHSVKTGTAYMDDNPINLYCLGNAVLDYDKLENCKPQKRNPEGRIDGLITMLMAMKLHMDR